MTINVLVAARAEALFASDLSQAATLTRPEATAAIAHALRRYGGTRGCAARMAAEYGEHPETAAARMRWARRTVHSLFPALAEHHGAVIPVPAATGGQLQALTTRSRPARFAA
jgi:hypothetical protein